ncbi:haloacid dehalogenase type II [Pseudonocardia acidicola]|uniref:Haloacid dehalogenase type II n=1 Tax=Pseudonocardia acidicola TaxID=2724939 RepID=A0ABX1SFV3_9PSEU|nr:haloacid dehalogenase type II [Pseudonocardia acidicola]NMH99139.1 haloacid dehalogenase type II [Pseudonocardia acidicola]
MSRPSVIVFDVNETLSDLTPLADRFTDVGAPRHLAPLWFASVLRDGIALAALGDFATFATLGREVGRSLLTTVELVEDVDAAVEHVMEGFLALPVHPDIPDGVRTLRAAGLRLVTLSNGAGAVAERLLGAAGLRAEFEHVLSVEDVGIWKPSERVYRHAATTCGTDPADMVMVAVHPWDLNGAAHAGMRTAWINRSGGVYPGYLPSPTYTVTGLPELAAALAG